VTVNTTKSINKFWKHLTPSSDRILFIASEPLSHVGMATISMEPSDSGERVARDHRCIDGGDDAVSVSAGATHDQDPLDGASHSESQRPLPHPQ
jgi:hypothetical protein